MATRYHLGHDRKPSAFLVYLYLWCHRKGRTQSTVASLQQIALETGLSKSAVQHAVRGLKRRRLIKARSTSATAVPEYVVQTPWIRA